MLTVNDLSFSYDRDRPLLHGIDMGLRAGDSIAIVGPSGSGKSTLLALLGLLLSPDTGTLSLDNCHVPARGALRDRIRREKTAWVFQEAHLLGQRPVIENVALPGLARGQGARESVEVARAMLTAVGMTDHEQAAVDTLSGGEAQRVCVARALCQRPCLVLADEPTGHLDRNNTELVIRCLVEATRDSVLYVATHDTWVADQCAQAFELVNGELI